MRKQLAEAAGEVMGRLSAASMESYSRAYPHLVRLHMLQEASDAAQLAARGSLGPIERQRILRWDERLRITQSSLVTQVKLHDMSAGSGAENACASPHILAQTAFS